MYNKEQPKKLIVVGSGAIGMEFGYFYKQFGTEVTVVEMMDRILPVEDEDVSKAMLRTTRRWASTSSSGTRSRVSRHQDRRQGHHRAVQGRQARREQEDPRGRPRPARDRREGPLRRAVRRLLGIETVKDHIKTDYVPIGPDSPMEPKALTYKTSVSGIYAIGDVIGPPWLAHVASEEAIACVERIAFPTARRSTSPSRSTTRSSRGAPTASPRSRQRRVHRAGAQAKGLKKGEDYEVGQFPFTALGKAIAAAHTDGFVKIIRGLPRGEILGAHIMGDQATELIAELSLARRMEATTEELIATIHAHPTMHESVHEAALASEGRVIHS
jgi:dihydrolipoamide dehydrogenase